MKESQRIQENAASIASSIAATNTDYRGYLFLQVAIKLRAYGQNATAQMVDTLAYDYGIEKPE